jgi:hypothetical protein
MSDCIKAFKDSGWNFKRLSLWTDAWNAALKSVEAAKPAHNKPSAQCYNKTCDAALNGECNFANVLCKIRKRTAHVG